MLPDSSAIDAALLALLQTDATLKAELPDGVYMDQAPPNCERFGLVSLVMATDVPAFGQRAIEDVIYLVKAVARVEDGSSTKVAAARIDQLLENTPLTVTGYGWMTCHREERVRYMEVDDVDTTLRWQHRGGRYRVQMALVTQGAVT